MLSNAYLMAASTQLNNPLILKNTILYNITKAIQSIQQEYVQKKAPLTNSDHQVHELCLQFDNILIYGLKRVQDSYWKVVVEFTHSDIVNEINSLLNVTTNFGRGRAWLYHALNDNLIESYLRCFMIDRNRELLLKFYRKDAFIVDEQNLNVLVTLAAGLENVQFKLFSDVSYLDHSCWPTHLFAKRDLVVQQQQNNSDNKQNSTATATATTQIRSTSANRKPKTKTSKRHLVNNVSLDSNSSSTNYSDLYTSDMRDNDLNHNHNSNNNNNNNRTDEEDNKTTNKKRSSTSSITSSDEIISSSVATTISSINKSKPLLSKKSFDNMRDQSTEIDNEINKLRIEAAAQAQAHAAQFTLSKSTDDEPAEYDADGDDEKESKTRRDKPTLNLNNSSDTVTTNFNRKLKDIETYSTIIENATTKMDECVKGMTKVYQSFEDDKHFYMESPTNESLLNAQNELQSTLAEQSSSSHNNNQINQDTSTNNDPNAKEDSSETSVYDIYTSSNNFDERKDLSMDSITSNKRDSREVFTSFDEKLKCDLRQEIKVDNNTKLMLHMNIFQNDQNEELIKLYHVTRGHTQGEIEELFLLITSYAIYILNKSDGSINSSTTTANNNHHNHHNNMKVRKEAVINHNEIDYIEVSLSSQAFHIVCINRRKHYWFTTGSRNLTDQILTNLQVSRERSPLKLQSLSILRDPTTQKIAIKKFIANHENISPQEFDIKSYSLIFWEDQTTATTQLIQKDGYLMYLLKSTSNSAHLLDFTGNSSQEWKRAYFVLKNDVLSQFRTHADKRAHHIIKLNGEDFSGCRKSSHSSRPHTIELILSNSTTLYLSAKTEAEASEWLQSFCKIISLGNYNTDVPAHTCLPCCCVITNQKLYYCHEDLSTNFFRLLDVIKLQELTGISYDPICQYFCILYAESENRKPKYWFVYFVDEVERNAFMNSLREAWETLFQIPFTIEKLTNNELLQRCQKGVDMIQSTWQNFSLNND